MREFDIEELLFRNPIVMHDEKTNSYFKDKVILITGGGGSTGSELCRQLAKMQPKKSSFWTSMRMVLMMFSRN